MSERDKDRTLFEEITQSLADDPAFVSASKEIDQRMRSIDRHILERKYPLLFDPTKPYYAELITTTGLAIAAEFVRLSVKYGLDPYDPAITTENFQQVHLELAVKAFQLSTQLASGDTVKATDALIIDLHADDRGYDAMVYVGSGDSVVGTYTSPVIGEMPDDQWAYSIDEMGGNPPIGVGLSLANPVLIGENGELYSDVFEGASAIVALGTTGLRLEKIIYQAA